MMGYLLKRVLAILLPLIALLVVGLAIWTCKQDSQLALADVLFWVGTVPIALCSFGIFGSFSGRGNAAYQLGRSVSSQSSSQRARGDLTSMTKSGVNWILAGLLLWIISLLV